MIKIKPAIIFAIATLAWFSSFAQIRFEEGYFISNDGKKTNCLIKNGDWANNPTEFYYRLSANSDIKQATIKDVSEFGIINFSKYKRFDVDVDQTQYLNSLGS